MFCDFQKSYYGRSGQQAISYTDFKTQSPLVVFDCSRANESVKKSAVDVRLEFEFMQDIPEGTYACVLIIHDQIFSNNPYTSIVHKVNQTKWWYS